MGQISQQHVQVYNGTAAADLSAKQWYFVYVDTSGKVALAATAGMLTLGVLMNKPGAANRAAEVALPGSVVPVIAGGTITAGDQVTCDSAGKVVTLTPPSYVDTQAGSATDPLLGKYRLGIALTDGASGAACQVLLCTPTPTLTVT